MSDDGGDVTPAEAFRVLGDETRVAILETLADTMQAGETNLSFSELRKRVGVRDAGQFNYHRSKLRDRFVVKRTDGYALRYGALRAVGAIKSGSYTDAPETRVAESETSCPDCDEPLTAEYDHGFFSMECDDHGRRPDRGPAERGRGPDARRTGVVRERGRPARPRTRRRRDVPDVAGRSPSPTASAANRTGSTRS